MWRKFGVRPKEEERRGNVANAQGYEIVKGVMMTKNKRSSEFSRDKIVDFGVKSVKKVVLKFFGQMCSDEFFLKHALQPSI